MYVGIILLRCQKARKRKPVFSCFIDNVSTVDAVTLRPLTTISESRPISFVNDTRKELSEYKKGYMLRYKRPAQFRVVGPSFPTDFTPFVISFRIHRYSLERPTSPDMFLSSSTCRCTTFSTLICTCRHRLCMRLALGMCFV